MKGGGSAGGWEQRGAAPESLTGARVVSEGAHAVPVRRKRAHALPGVCQPALDRPVRAARVHVPVHELGRKREGGAGPRLLPQPVTRIPQTTPCGGGGARARLTGNRGRAGKTCRGDPPNGPF